MMDGRVAAIRDALDVDELTDTPILSYASKFASAFMARFARPPTLLLNLAIVAATRWMVPIVAKPCAKSSSISPRAPT